MRTAAGLFFIPETDAEEKDIFVNSPFSGNDSFDLDNTAAYGRWREEKLDGYPTDPTDLLVEIDDFSQPSRGELVALGERVKKTNMALYSCPSPSARRMESAKAAIDSLSLRFGMRRRDANLCADEDAVSPLSVAEGGRRERYIPYTNRPISWHTDGYYNRPDHQIRGMVLHCVSPAAEGGANALLDPEIAYIYLRDENPDYIRALSHPEAMLIPANDEGGGVIRPARMGPVFSVSGNDGSLHMRYTARSRSIVWRDDPATAAAVGFLGELLNGGCPYIFNHRMAAGQGVLCNNVLHNRGGFEDSDDHKRLFLRARYFDRISMQ